GRDSVGSKQKSGTGGGSSISKRDHTVFRPQNELTRLRRIWFAQRSMYRWFLCAFSRALRFPTRSISGGRRTHGRCEYSVPFAVWDGQDSSHDVGRRGIGNLGRPLSQT